MTATTYPAGPLMDALGASTPAALARAVSVDVGTARQAIENGMSEGQAKSWARVARLDPQVVWAPCERPVKPTTPPTINGFEWVEELPPRPLQSHAGRLGWAQKLEPMRAHPGRWARVARTDTIKKAHGRRFWMLKTLGAGWEVEWRPDGDGVSIYARYVGEA